MNSTSIVVGAGIAGLATAVALKLRGHHAVVLERRPGPATEGAGIQIGPNGTAALDALGVREAVRPRASVPLGIAVHGGLDDMRLTTLPLGDWIAARHGAPYWVVHRADLLDALHERAHALDIDVRYGVRIADMTADTNAVAVTLASGEIVHGGLLVGADGVWSAVRTQVVRDTSTFFTGRVAYRALVDPSVVPRIARDHVSVWMAPDTHAVAYPVRAGAAINLVLVTRGEAAASRWSTPADEAELRALSARFPQTVRAAVSVAPAWLKWPLHGLTPLPAYHRPRVALVGDAAHAMLPFLAQGGVMALEDALVLARVVAGHESMPDALAAFDRARRPRAARVVAAAERQGRIFHLAGIAAMARDAALKVVPPALLMQRYDWLYGARVA